MNNYATRAATAVFLDTAPAGPPAGFRLADRVDIALPKRDPDTGEPLPLLACPFAAMLLGDGESDATGTVVVKGTEYSVMPGDGGIIVLMLARRKPGLTHDAFIDRWLKGHAPFGLRTAASGYRQLHDTRGGPFDGVGMVFFRDLDHVASSRAAPEVARDATPDEMAFIDHGQSMLAMFRFR